MGRRSYSFAVCLALPALLALAAAPSAEAIGANLNRPANNAASCRYLPTTTFNGFRQYIFEGLGSCTYVGTGDIQGREQTRAPAPGVVTRIRVRAGPVVGPVRATVAEAIASTSTPLACCFGRSQSQVFTPRPNAITAVNVRLPMRNDTDFDNGVQTVDYLGLSVLGGNFPVPAFDGGVPGDFTRSGSLFFRPTILPGQERADGAGVNDFVPLISFDFQRICGAGVIIRRGAAGAKASQLATGGSLSGAGAARLRAPRAEAAKGGCAPRGTVVGGSAPVRGGRAILRVACNFAFGCNGLVRLQSRRRGGATFGSSSFKLRGGGVKKVKVGLNRAGRRAGSAWANFRFKGRPRKASKQIKLG